MVVSNMSDKRCIMAEGQMVETVEEFCYLGSVISFTSSCDKDIKTRLGKANSVVGRLNAIWKSRDLNCNIKIRGVNHRGDRGRWSPQSFDWGIEYLISPQCLTRLKTKKHHF